MACTTILVGKAASYDGSTMIARNDDSGSGHFTAKKFTVIHPEELPKTYRSVLSHVEIPLPEGALRFTAMPNAVEGKGIWAASGVNAANVGMTATETITSACWAQTRWWSISLPRAKSLRCPAASARKISSIWCCPISTLPARACCVWAVCWSSTVLTR